LKDAEVLKLEETNRSLDEQLQSAMDDVGEKTTELETVSIESVYDIIELVVTKSPIELQTSQHRICWHCHIVTCMKC